MALTKLTFTKDWTNSNDFPTIETSEQQVRADIQLLHNETKTALNNAIDALKSITDSDSGADSVGCTALPQRSAITVQGALEELNTAAVSASRLVAMLTGIQSVVTTLGNDNTTIPTSKAVADSISQAGGGDMMRSSYDTTNTGNKVDTAINAESLGGQAPSYYLKRNYTLVSTITEWNQEIRYSTISSLNFVCPSVPADIAAEIRGSFVAGSGFTMAITPPAGMTILEDDNNPTITTGKLYEFSLAVINSTYLSLLIQERAVS